ncbi:lipid binding protein [Trifolium pratense]|uniref:Lipid binding protein n=1 Tax=Trifolium pratense TaxID=57577 RepID=A0A2K3MZW8_TRIPR|nr:lipid binding protein [Trifolium pratense]
MEGVGGGGGEGSGGGGGGGMFEYFGWVYHLGVNSIGHEYCHLRFLFIRGKYVSMYKRDPHENPGIKPIRQGVIGPTLMVEELGRRKVNNGDFYVIRFYNRLDETRKGELGKHKDGWRHLNKPRTRLSMSFQEALVLEID